MKLCFIFILLMAISMLTHAVVDVKTAPDNLIYKGNLIDPLCFIETSHVSDVINLDQCGLQAEPRRTNVGKNRQLINQGYLGYDYDITVDHAVRLRGYSYYKKVGTIGRATLVQTLYHAGGTGEVSSLRLIKRDGAHLTVTVLHVGDRCNHGLVEVTREQHAPQDRLVYSMKLTSHDFLMLADVNPHHLKAFDDLADCAICCKATAVFERSMGPDFHQETLRTVNLAAFPHEETVDSSPQSYQGCFDTLINQYIKTGQTTLNAKQLTRFMQRFNARCVESIKKST